jgi:hypothetical protein
MEATPPSQVRTRWPRLGAESTAIVLSILLAFAIDAGWDERQERGEEAEILESLAVEFEQYRDRFARRSEFYEQTAANIVWLLDEVDFSSSELERLDEGLLAFVGAPTLEVGSGVNTELVASGRVSLISDPTLRRIVSTWQGRLDEITDDEIVVRQYVTTVLVPYLASLNAPLGRASRIPKGAAWRLSVTSDDEALIIYRALVDEPEFRALASWRYDWALSSAQGFGRGVAAADSALSVVRANLGG